MKKVLSILLVIVILITLTGCNKEKTRFKKEIVVECTSKQKDLDGYNGKVTVQYSTKANFDKNGYLVSAEYTSVNKIADSETYELFKSEIDEESITEYTYDEENKTITGKSTYKTNLEEITESEKEELFVKDFVTNSESANYTCEITGATRKKIGLE